MSEKKYSVLPGTEGYGLESVEALVALGVPAKVGRIVSRCLNDDWDGDNEDSGSQMVRGNVSDAALVPTEMVDQLIAGWVPTQTPPKDRFGYITWNPNPAFLRTPYGPRRAAIKPQSWPSRRKGNMKTEMAKVLAECGTSRTPWTIVHGTIGSWGIYAPSEDVAYLVRSWMETGEMQALVRDDKTVIWYGPFGAPRTDCETPYMERSQIAEADGKEI